MHKHSRPQREPHLRREVDKRLGIRHLRVVDLQLHRLRLRAVPTTPTACYSKNTFGSYVDNITVSGSTYGLYLQNSTSGTVSNIDMLNNTYGIYLDLTNGVSFSRLDARRATGTGVYAASGGSDVFKGGGAG